MRFRSRTHLEMWQQRHLAEFIRDTLPKAGRFRGLGEASLVELPYIYKTFMMSDFEYFNTRGITLQEATGVALHAEGTRNFKPLLGDLTVGRSSGTSGAPGVFLVSRAERQRWAGIALSRALPSHLLRALLTPEGPCSCGRPEMTISAIAGRADEVLLLPSLRRQTPTRVFPDVLRRAMLLAGPALQKYRITQREAVWELEVQIVQEETATLRRIRDSLTALCQRLLLLLYLCEPGLVTLRRGGTSGGKGGFEL
jgi:phenylacetate-coenzyme A ligase PaaK-like adenylate-forming protein